MRGKAISLSKTRQDVSQEFGIPMLAKSHSKYQTEGGGHLSK